MNFATFTQIVLVYGSNFIIYGPKTSNMNNSIDLVWNNLLTNYPLLSLSMCLEKKNSNLTFNSRGRIWFKEQHYKLTEKKASSNTRIGPEKPTTRRGWAPSRQNNTPWTHVATISSDTPMSPSVFSPVHIRQTRAPESWIIEHRCQTHMPLEFRASNLKCLSESE